MKGIDFPQSNNTLGKPSNMTDEQCYSLPVRHEFNQDGFPEVYSCWELSDEEIEQVAKTRKVWVSQLGDTIAPMCVHGIEPFERRKLLLHNPDGLIGDFLGTIPVMIALAKVHDLTVNIHHEATELFDLIPKRYGIKIFEHQDQGPFESVIALNISRSFEISHQHNLYMSQSHFASLVMWVPPVPPKAELEVPDIEVPEYDFIIAPFSRSLPALERWEKDRWQRLVNHYPDLRFAIIGSDSNERSFVTGPNVTEEYGRPIVEVCNLLKKAKKGLISVVSGPSHLAFHLGVKNILLTNQNMTWGNNPEGIKITEAIPDLSVIEVASVIDSLNQ